MIALRCQRLFLMVACLWMLVMPTASALQAAGDAASAQEQKTEQSAAGKEQPGISDNSFLIEEAYNQEFGVVQHINLFQRLWNSEDWVYSFTQEWPFDPAPKNQLSYTIFAQHSGAMPGSGAGLGDIALNYRYQVLEGKRVWFTPRLSLLLPTGDVKRGRGAGGFGIQTNWAFSIPLQKKLVSHWNMGATFMPRAKDAANDRAAAYGYNFGQSFIYLAHPRFNLMLETVFNSTEAVTAPGQTQRSNSILISPGFRWAYNLKNGTQIVPGIGLPAGIGPSQGEAGLIFYFSVEHPYRKLKK